METEIEEEKNVSTYNEENKGGSRYLTSKKKQYLLASNQESIQQLIENQTEQLTNILIQQKSEYDKLTRESNQKKEASELLDKKIKALQGMDEKTKKKAKENKESIDTMKSVIKIKNGRKDEENYNKKTLQKQVDKLNQDLLLIQKEILTDENRGKILDRKLQKAKFNENTIRQKRNDVHSQIESQELKNKYSKNEQDLQIQYYETVIKQKYMFIQSADERKERQKKIAQDAKNDSQDKQEVEKRHELHLLVLYNQYLREKMGELIQNNEKMEATLEEIRDITGTENLDLLVETILLRDKRYNHCCKRVAETEKKKKELGEELIKLNEEYINLKNQVLVQEEPNDEAKSISTIPTTHVEDEEKELIEKEKTLNKKLYDIGEKHNLVNLAYSKVIENMKTLKEIDDNDPNKIEENNKEELKLNDENNDNNIETTNMETNIKEGEEEKKEEEEVKKEDEIEKVEEKKEENNENQLAEDNGEDEQVEEKKEGEGEGEEEEKEKEIILTEEEEEAIQQYIEFLHQSSKKFDILFLLHSKQEFLHIMEEKGKEMENLRYSQNKKNTNKGSTERKVNKRVTKIRKTNRLLTSLSRISRKSKNDDEKEKKVIIESKKKKEEEDDKSNYDPDKDILKRFMDEQKKERDEFIKVVDAGKVNTRKSVVAKK